MLRKTASGFLKWFPTGKSSIANLLSERYPDCVCKEVGVTNLSSGSNQFTDNVELRAKLYAEQILTNTYLY